MDRRQVSSALIDVDADSDATLSSGSELDADFVIETVPKHTRQHLSPQPERRLSSAAAASSSMAESRGNLLHTATVGGCNSGDRNQEKRCPQVSNGGGGAARLNVKRMLLTAPPNGKKRRLLAPVNGEAPVSVLDFMLRAAPEQPSRRPQGGYSGAIDGEEEEKAYEPLVAHVDAMSSVRATATWLCGRWLGQSELQFHAAYLEMTMWSRATPTEPAMRVWKGSLQYRQLVRFSLSHGKSPYYAVMEIVRMQELPPTFCEFYDAILAQSTQENAFTPKPDIYGVVFFFEDDLELVRCQSMSEKSASLAALLGIRIPMEESNEIVALEREEGGSRSPGVLSAISGKVWGTIGAISNMLSPDRSPQKELAHRKSVDHPGGDTSDHDSSSMSSRFRSRSRRRSLRQRNHDVEIVVQLGDDVKERCNVSDKIEQKLTSDRRSTRGVLQLMEQHHKREIERLTAERKSKLLLSYPFEESDLPGKISITYGDIDRLAPGEFLNDSIIDFYLRYLWRHLESWQQKQVYFFSSHFFTQISGGRISSNTDGLEERFGRVSRWTHKEDLFEKRFIFVPINDSCHWSVAVICNPGSAIVHKKRRTASQKFEPHQMRSVNLVDDNDFFRDTIIIDTTEEASNSEYDNEEEEWTREERKKHPPCILFLDSLRCHQKKKICALLRSYLHCEFKSRFEKAGDVKGPRGNNVVTSFDSEGIELIEPEVPLQSNSSDCGVFLLMYTAQILQRLPTGLTQDAFETRLASSMSKDMFDNGHVRDFRDYLHQLIFMLESLERRGAVESSVRDEGLEFFAVEH